MTPTPKPSAKKMKTVHCCRHQIDLDGVCYKCEEELQALQYKFSTCPDCGSRHISETCPHCELVGLREELEKYKEAFCLHVCGHAGEHIDPCSNKS